MYNLQVIKQVCQLTNDLWRSVCIVEKGKRSFLASDDDTTYLIMENKCSSVCGTFTY